MQAGFVRGAKLVEGTTPPAQVVGMASSTRTVSTADWAELLPDVQLEVRQGGTRPALYTLSEIDFLIGSATGCDLRISADTPAVLCLLARHPAGVSLRKLAPTQAILVNGQGVSQRELVDGDRVQIGLLAIHVRIAPVRAAAPSTPTALQEGAGRKIAPTHPEGEGSGDLAKTQRAFQERVQQFREQLVLFQHEKNALERQRQDLLKQTQPANSPAWDSQRAELVSELQRRETLLEERAAEIEHQKQELAKVRQEMADVRRQLYEHYQERRDRLASLQEDLEKTKSELDARNNKLRLEEQDAGDRRQRDRQRQEELDQRSAEVTQEWLRIEQERRQLEDRRQAFQDHWTKKNADLEPRERTLAEKTREFDVKIKQYEADVLRLNRLQGGLELREIELRTGTDELTRQREQLQRDTRELQEQLGHLDEWRTKLADEGERLSLQRQEQDTLARQLADRTASLEGQQATLAMLRGRLERMREEMRSREQQVDEQRDRQESRDAQLTLKQQEIDKLQREMQADQEQYAHDREQWVQRSAVMDAAVRQLKGAQENLAVEDERVRREAREIDELRRQITDADGVLQGRLAQLAEAQERMDLERQSLQQRSVNIVQREQACATLQEQLHRRSEEIAARHKEITDRLLEYQTKFAELDARERQLAERDQEFNQQIETWQRELEKKADAVQEQHAVAAGVDEEHQKQIGHLAFQRETHAQERAQFQREQQAALDKLAQARTELETLRSEATTFIQQLPDAELRAGTAVERLSHARAQLASHLGEIHHYVRQCQDELEQLRGRLQADLDKLQEQEQTLRRNQDEHRLAVVAFRQQLIDWQGQIAELKRLLSRDETRLERRQAQVDERAKEMEAESQRLAQQAVELQEQERDVADRRQEMDRHLVDMREWYRRKLRELAGIPLVPDSAKSDAEPTILAVRANAEGSATTDDGEPGIVPTMRSILSITGAVDQGDQKLGEVLRAAQLVDADTLTALLAEARRQRRSLRQVLLASGVITLYQLALIEAGNVDGLMLGPVRIIDRLRTTAHETVYRVFDPRRGTEAVLRHLAEADMTDAAKPDEFRQRFAQAMLNDPHLANTLEVLELSGRPAAVQEWLSGLPASDWPPLAAAPGVCYRLLTQAAKGLARAHQAGVVHGHLSDSLLLLTGDGVLKICGLGEPPWLIGLQHDEEPTSRDDLCALGKIVSSWCTPPGVRKGPKTKPLPDALVSALYRLAADGDAAYRDVGELLDDLQKSAGAIPPNAEAWDRLVKYVREHGSAEALLRQSA
jgi:chromosome segregation ATPase